MTLTKTLGLNPMGILFLLVLGCSVTEKNNQTGDRDALRTTVIR
jgi:hypothetical protein